MLHSDRRSLQNPVKNILDGELLNKYLYLSMMERSELAKKIGTTQDIVSTPLWGGGWRRRRSRAELLPSPRQILDDLLDIDRVTAHF